MTMDMMNDNEDEYDDVEDQKTVKAFKASTGKKCFNSSHSGSAYCTSD